MWKFIRRNFAASSSCRTHPWVVGMCRDALGPNYQIVEIGFDTPFQGAKNQPWHRDFPSPPDTYEEKRITSLAFNLTGVDVTPDMGPFEVAVGTQYVDGRLWNHEMFPPRRAGTNSLARASRNIRRWATYRAALRSPSTAAPRIPRRSRGPSWSSASTRPEPATTSCTI